MDEFIKYYPSDWIYENVERLAAKWLVNHAENAANPVIKQINFKSWRYTDLIMALREAYAAGMITGAMLQQQLNAGEEPKM